MGFSSWKIGEPSKRVVTTVLISGLELVYADVEFWSTFLHESRSFRPIVEALGGYVT